MVNRVDFKRTKHFDPTTPESAIVLFLIPCIESHLAMTTFAIFFVLISQAMSIHAFTVPIETIQTQRSLVHHSTQRYKWRTAKKFGHQPILLSPSHKILNSSLKFPSRNYGRFSRLQLNERPLDIDSMNTSIRENNMNMIKALSTVAFLASIYLIRSLSLNHLSVPTLGDMSLGISNFFDDPKSSMEQVVNSVQAMGPIGLVYFGFVYTIAEILALPAIPLTASAGYLFGVVQGTAIVLLSASIAAACSFLIGRTFLRSYVEKVLENYPEFKRIDKVIGQEGFKLMLLLRLSPIFPFALSNYFYGVTSVKFWPYFWGTFFGFFPGTIAYVYTGQLGAKLSLGDISHEPWYIYAGGLLIFTMFLKFIADTATGVIRKMEESNDSNDE